MIGRALRRAIEKKRDYPTVSGWLLSVYDAILRRTDLPFLPWRNRVVTVKLHDLAQPVCLRLGTSDWLVLWEIYVERVYEPLVRSCPHDTATIVDLGANIGLSVRLWLERFPAAVIVAVEPDPQNIALLRQNVELSGQQERVRILQACVAGQEDSLYLHRSDRPWAFEVRTEPHPQSIAVRAMTVETVLEECNLQGGIGAVKCDIEGAERDVFGTCRHWIARVTRFAVELHGHYHLEDLLNDTRRGGRTFRVMHSRPGQSGDGLVFLEGPEKVIVT